MQPSPAKDARLTKTFAALADPTRRRVLARLTRGTATVGELASDTDISAPSFSRHLQVLEQAGLIARATDAQWRHCRLETTALREAFDWLKDYERLWDEQFDKLADYIGRLDVPARGKARGQRRK
jgi:DNA-binding transcriptional ArsR family regulator